MQLNESCNINKSEIEFYLIKKKVSYFYNMVYYIWTLYVLTVKMYARLMQTSFGGAIDRSYLIWM